MYLPYAWCGIRVQVKGTTASKKIPPRPTVKAESKKWLRSIWLI